MSFWTDDSPPSTPTRSADRLFLGAATIFTGGRSEPYSYVQTVGGSDYIDRSAQFASYSPNGGTGGAFATRQSDGYYAQGYNPWTPNTYYAAGAKVGWRGKLYHATTGGTSGTAGPSHSSGTATDGSVTWAWDNHAYVVPIAGAFFAVQDGNDGYCPVWAIYGETVRTGQASSFIGEFAAKNKGSDFVPTPYAFFGGAMGFWMPAGGDASVGAPTAPSSAAIIIGKNAQTWNAGIVFTSDGITGADGNNGSGAAIAMGKGHRIDWHAPNGLAASITSVISTSADKQSIVFDQWGVWFNNNQGIGGFRVGKTNGAITGSLFVQARNDGGPPYVAAEGTANDIDLQLTPKGSGKVRFGTYTSGGGSIAGYISIKDAGGTVRKVAILA